MAIFDFTTNLRDANMISTGGAITKTYFQNPTSGVAFYSLFNAGHAGTAIAIQCNARLHFGTYNATVAATAMYGLRYRSLNSVSTAWATLASGTLPMTSAAVIAHEIPIFAFTTASIALPIEWAVVVSCSNAQVKFSDIGVSTNASSIGVAGLSSIIVRTIGKLGE